MQFLGATSGFHMVASGNGAAVQSGKSLGAQGTATAQVQGAVDLLKQVKQLMEMAEKEKLLQIKN